MDRAARNWGRQSENDSGLARGRPAVFPGGEVPFLEAETCFDRAFLYAPEAELWNLKYLSKTSLTCMDGEYAIVIREFLEQEKVKSSENGNYDVDLIELIKIVEHDQPPLIVPVVMLDLVHLPVVQQATKPVVQGDDS